MCLLLSLHLRLRLASVVFDFNDSLNDVAPVSPMLFPVDVLRNEKSELLMDVFGVFFLLSSLHKESFVSVVFDFNESLSDVVPVSPMLFPVDVLRNEKSELLMDVFLCVFFLLSLRCRLSFVSVVFDFSDSLNDVAPVSPMQLSDYVKRKEKERIID